MLFGGRHYLKNGTRLFVMQVGATVIGVIAMVIISMIDYDHRAAAPVITDAAALHYVCDISS